MVAVVVIQARAPDARLRLHNLPSCWQQETGTASNQTHSVREKHPVVCQTN